MSIRPEDVPSDPARLAAMVLALDAENERLRAIVRTLKDLLFRARSERAPVIDVAQLPLDLDNLAVGVAPSRIGQVNVSAYLPKGCQASLRLLYAQSGRPQRELIAEALNDLFAKYDVPQVRED